MDAQSQYERCQGLILLGYVTEVADLWLQTPVPFVLHEKGMFVKESVYSISTPKK